MRGIVFALLFFIVFFATFAILHISGEKTEVIENTYIVLNEEPITGQTVLEVPVDPVSKIRYDFSDEFPGLHKYEYSDLIDQTVIMQERSKVLITGDQNRLFLKLYVDEGNKIAIVDDFILSDTMDIEIDFFDTGKYILRDEYFNEVKFEIIDWKNS